MQPNKNFPNLAGAVSRMSANDISAVQYPTPGAVVRIEQGRNGGFLIMLKSSGGTGWTAADYCVTMEQAVARAKQLAESVKRTAANPIPPREFDIDGNEVK